LGILIAGIAGSTIVLATGWFLALRPFADPTRFAALLIILINALMALPCHPRRRSAYVIHRQRSNVSLQPRLGGISACALSIGPACASAADSFVFCNGPVFGDLEQSLFSVGQSRHLPWLVYSRLGSYRTNDAGRLDLTSEFYVCC